jgi:hypothetical protein
LIFAKPPWGFRWSETPAAAAQVDEEISRNEHIRPRWEGVKDRLVHTAAKEGTPLRGMEAGLFAVAIEATALVGPIWIVYQLSGDTLTVHSVQFPEPDQTIPF